MQRYKVVMSTMQSDEIDSEIAAIRTDIAVLKWMTGLTLAFEIAIFAKLFH